MSDQVMTRKQMVAKIQALESRIAEYEYILRNKNEVLAEQDAMISNLQEQVVDLRSKVRTEQ